jgi:hypothetical protein
MSRGNARSLLGSSSRSTDVPSAVLYATAEKHDLILNIWLHLKVWKRTYDFESKQYDRQYCVILQSNDQQV